MGRVLLVALPAIATFPADFLGRDQPFAHAAAAAANGDTNGDGSRDLSDAVYLLAWLFREGPAPLPCSHPSGMPDTGQARCCDAAGNEVACDSANCPGQDRLHGPSCPSESRFVDNGDGTVTDTCTGLMWQQDTADTNGDGTIDPATDHLDWCGALQYCDDLSLAGHDDWRLPNVLELQSIVDRWRSDPAIDPVFGSFASLYWSSTVYASLPDAAWYVSFFVGFMNFNFEDYLSHVRAVRGGSGVVAVQNGDTNGDGARDVSDAVYLLAELFREGPAVVPCPSSDVPAALPDTGQTLCYHFVRPNSPWAPGPCEEAPCPGQDGAYATGCLSNGRFVDNRDGTVTDNCTGLMWQKDTVPELPWCEALAYCDDLSLAGHDDWRLPNVLELQSLVDYGRFGPAINPALRVSRSYWSSTSHALDPAQAWYINFFFGYVNGHGKAYTRSVRAVRTGR